MRWCCWVGREDKNVKGSCSAIAVLSRCCRDLPSQHQQKRWPIAASAKRHAPSLMPRHVRGVGFRPHFIKRTFNVLTLHQRIC